MKPWFHTLNKLTPSASGHYRISGSYFKYDKYLQQSTLTVAQQFIIHFHDVQNEDWL